MTRNNLPAVALLTFCATIGLATVIAFWIRFPAIIEYLNQGAPV